MFLSNIAYAENVENSTFVTNNNIELTVTFQEMSKIIPSVKASDVLNLAKHYYSLSNPKIEEAAKSEYKRIVNWIPNFTGTKTDVDKAKEASVSVALAVSYTNAKNFYLSMASAVFALDPRDVIGAGNFASAVASYYDDLVLEGKKEKNMEKYYLDAIKLYNCGLKTSVKDGKFSKDALSLLVSLGNIYLDTGKKDKAYTCFRMAMAIEKGYWPARKAMYNYYMSEKKFDEALRLIMEENEYPVFVKAASKVSKIKDEEDKKNPIPQGEVADEVMEKYLDNLVIVDAISQADFLEEIDKEAHSKLKALIKEVQSRMKFTAPDISMVTQYSSLKSISSPDGQGTLSAFQKGIESYGYRAEYLGEKSYADSLDDFGYETDLGGYNTQQDFEAAIMGNPDFHLNINIDWTGDVDAQFEAFVAELEKNVAQYEQDPSKGEDLFKTISKVQPEKAVFALNPFFYSNPLDIYIQKLNMADFEKKFLPYEQYLVKITHKNSKMVTDALRDGNERTGRLHDNIIRMEQEIEDEQQLHNIVHMGLVPDYNRTNEVLWNQITQLALDNYTKKTKKYVEKMYSDCMKHVILISDEKIQKMLEERVIALALRSISTALMDIYNAYSFGDYSPPEDCGCDEKAMAAARAAREKAENAAANELIKKNIEAKKKFESGELDENSAYYKKVIKPYEVKVTSPFFQGIVGPYKSGWKFNMAGLDFGKMQQHIRNSTTYDGGIEIKLVGGEVGDFEGGLSLFGRFNATKAEGKSLSMSDVDLTGGAKAELTAPGLISAAAGASVSSVRGTKVFGGFGFTGDNLLDEDIKTFLGNWKPDLTIIEWNGEYDIK
jgi:hypothetical protein